MQRFATPIVLRPGEGREIDLGNFAMVVKATGADSGGSFSLLEAAEPPNFGPPIHVHQDCEADPKKLDEIAARHGMEVVGPVPEGYL